MLPAIVKAYAQGRGASELPSQQSLSKIAQIRASGAWELPHINHRSKACTEAVANAMNLKWAHPTVICLYPHSQGYGYQSWAGSLPSVILTFMSFHLFVFVPWGENILHSCRETLQHLSSYIFTIQQHRTILHNKYHHCSNCTEVCQHPYPHAKLQ